MSTTKPTATATDSSSDTGSKNLNPFTDWGHEEHDKSIPTDEATLAMGNQTDFYPQSPVTGNSHNPSEDASTANTDGLIHRMRKHNRDIWWAYRDDVALSESLDNQYKRGVIGSFVTHLGLSDLLAQRAFEWFMRLDLQRMGLRIEMVAFAICISVVNEQADRYGDSGRAYDPQHSNVDKKEDFRDLQDDLISRYKTVSTAQITSAIQKIEQGNPPTRPKRKWKHFVKNESFTSLHAPSGGEAERQR
jgi:hypothetical protein